MKEDDPTKPLPPGVELMQEILDRIKSLEVKVDKVDERINTLEVKVDSLDAKVDSLDAKVDERLKDTRPIWERALSEILEVKEAVKRFDRKLDLLNRGLFDLRAEHEELAARVPPPEPTQ